MNYHKGIVKNRTWDITIRKSGLNPYIQNLDMVVKIVLLKSTYPQGVVWELKIGHKMARVIQIFG